MSDGALHAWHVAMRWTAPFPFPVRSMGVADRASASGRWFPKGSRPDPHRPLAIEGHPAED